jgi:hypothetical protein
MGFEFERVLMRVMGRVYDGGVVRRTDACQ